MTTFSQLLEKAKQGNSYWESKIRHKFALQLLENLKAKDVSRAEFAKNAGISSGYLSRVLAGNENLSIKTIVKLSRALELEVELYAHAGSPRFRAVKIMDESREWEALTQYTLRQHGSPRFKLTKPSNAINENAYCSSAAVSTEESISMAA